MNDDEINFCIYCDSSCHSDSSTDSSIQCSRCNHYYHLHCCGVPADVHSIATKMFKLLGWTCEACRLIDHDTIRSLQREIETIRTELNNLKQGHQNDRSNSGGSNQVECVPTGVPPNKTYSTAAASGLNLRNAAGTHSAGLASPTTNVSKSEVVSMVLGSIKEINKRKRNVIITGLHEDPRKTDSTIAAEFFEHFFPSIKPHILSTVRLGKTIGSNTVRRLLVRFSSDHDANSILSSAKVLRNALDGHVRSNVFINADLTKEESKLAYEKRVNKRKQLSSMDNQGADIQMAQPRQGYKNPSLPSDDPIVSAGLRPTATEFLPCDASSITVVNSTRSASCTSSSNNSSESAAT